MGEVRKMKVLLISSNTAASPYPVYPLGLSMVAQALRESGNEVEIFDFLQNQQSLEALAKTVDTFQPRAVGLSIRNIDNVNLLHEERYIDQATKIVKQIRAVAKTTIVAGGSAFSILPEEIMAAIKADYGIVGEGETAFPQLLRQIEQGNPPPAGTIVRNQTLLDCRYLPSAYYEPELMKHYLNNGSIASVQTKRGCPLNCVYCSYPALEGNRLRIRPPSAVVDNIESLITEHGAKFLFFTDSVFNDDQGQYLEVLREMKERGIRIPWSAFIKPSELTPATIQLMQETGLKAAELGSDAACDTTLQGQNKTFTWQEVTETSRALMEAGISTAHYFMFGGPGETPDTVRQGIENIKNLRCSAAFVFMGIRILPETELYEIAKKEGKISENAGLLEPIYYISPAVEQTWLEQILTKEFEPCSHILFPPDALDDKVQLLHKLGHAGALWDLLTPEYSEKNYQP